MSMNLPHPLVTAHHQLREKLQQAIDFYKETHRFPKPIEVCDLIEHFVSELCRIPGCKAELRRRATFVEEQCKQGSTFREAMNSALKRFKISAKGKKRLTVERVEEFIHELHNLKEGDITFVSTLEKYRRELDWLFENEFVGATQQNNFELWKAEILRIIDEARHLEADGCFYLWHFYHARNPGAPETSKATKAMFAVTNGMGRVFLEPIKSGAESIIAWSKHESLPENLQGKEMAHRVPKKRGRPADTDFKEDEKRWEAWSTGNYETYEQLGRAFMETAYKAKLAVKRHKERQKRKAERDTK